MFNTTEVQSFLRESSTEHQVTYPRPGEAVHSLTFHDSLGALDVANILSRPLAGYILEFNEVNVKRGIANFAMQGSRLHRDAFRLGQHVISKLDAVRPDMLGLATVIRGDEATEVATVEVYDEADAMLVARERLLDKKVREIQTLSNGIGLSVDELSLMRSIARQKHGRRQLRLYDLDDAGTDAERLRQVVLDNEFYRKLIRTDDGFHPVLMLHSQAPGTADRTSKVVELGKEVPRLTELPDEIIPGERRQVTYYRNNVMRHRAIPIIRYREKQRDSVNSLITLDFTGASQTYDADSHITYHLSPQLGIAMLANCVDAGIFSQPLHKLFQNNPNNPKTHLPPIAAGALPVLSHIPEIAAKLTWSSQFRHLRQTE